MSERRLKNPYVVVRYRMGEHYDWISAEAAEQHVAAFKYPSLEIVSEYLPIQDAINFAYMLNKQRDIEKGEQSG